MALPKNDDIDTALKIVLFMRKKDRPLIANHIAKGIKESPQLVDHHLRRLVNQGIILFQDDMGSRFYILQPVFYMEPAERSLMTILTPWVTEVAKQIVIDPEAKFTREEVVRRNLLFYFNAFLHEIKDTLK